MREELINDESCPREGDGQRRESAGRYAVPASVRGRPLKRTCAIGTKCFHVLSEGFPPNIRSVVGVRGLINDEPCPCEGMVNGGAVR